MMKYAEIRPSLKTGDIVLMGGTTIVSRIIRLVSDSAWSHVGMVMKVADCDLVLFWESTTEPHGMDLLSGKPKRGVQLTPLSRRAKEFLTGGGTMAIRRLKAPLSTGAKNAIQHFRQDIGDRDFDWNVLRLMSSVVDSPGWENEKDLDALFCSELVAETLQVAGILDDGVPSSEYTPRDFSAHARKPLAFLGPEIPIVA